MNKGIVRKLVVGSILIALSAASAGASLIVNGGFEDPTGSAIGGGGGWKYYDSADVPGWDGSNIELWGTLGIDSYEGNYHAELNAHGQSTSEGPWSISQTFATTAGKTYNLSFAYGARLGSATESNEEFRVRVDGLDFNLTDHVVGLWSTYSGSFVADGDFATLNFSSVAQDRWTYGNFLDDVSVTATPIPGTLVLLSLGLAGLGAIRKKAK